MTAWRTDRPAPGKVAIVWYYTVEMRATWDGSAWRDADGCELYGVTHWREA